MGTPSVSVIIPAYNAVETIGACLRSVIAAEYDGEREVIVVDDGSIDETCAIVEQHSCHLIRQPSNSGPAAARNAGAKAAHGEILLFIDSDTEMRLDSISEAVRALEEKGVGAGAGAGAVTGTYEAEPLNPGFFPAYYAYLKYHAFTGKPVSRVHAFGAQCAAIRKDLFNRVGGFRPLPWGVDVENEELGHRINRHSSIALSTAFRVGHNFPALSKLMFIFTGRVYWWILFRHYCKQDETVLMTRSFGLGTAAMPAAALALLLGLIIPPGPWSSALVAVAIGLAGWFTYAYSGFWRFCAQRRGLGFAGAAALASVFFALVITVSAAAGYVAVGWSTLRKRELPFVAASPGQA